MTENVTVEIPNINENTYLCINYNGKVIEFKDKDCANYVHTLRKLLKRCKRIVEIDESVSITGAGREFLWDLLQDLNQVLGEE